MSYNIFLQCNLFIWAVQKQLFIFIQFQILYFAAVLYIYNVILLVLYYWTLKYFKKVGFKFCFLELFKDLCWLFPLFVMEKFRKM